MSLSEIKVTILVMILSGLVLLTGCKINRWPVTYKDLSGPFFSKNIGCSIYFTFMPEHGGKGVSKYLYPMNDLYAIKPDGKLERQYVPELNTWPSKFELTDYGYPIIVDNLSLGLFRLTADGRTESIIAKGETEKKIKSDFLELLFVSQNGQKALIITGYTEDNEYSTAVIDLTSGESLYEAKFPWFNFHAVFLNRNSADAELANILMMDEIMEYSSSGERISWWEPYIFHFDDENKLSYKKLQFPPPEPKGLCNVIMIPTDGRVIGVTHDGTSARLYQFMPPYDEPNLLLTLELPPLELESYNRDGSRILVSWRTDNYMHHYAIFELPSGKTVELPTEDRRVSSSTPMLSPQGDRVVVVPELGFFGKKSFSVYDGFTGELIDFAEWKHEGHFYNIKVGY